MRPLASWFAVILAGFASTGFASIGFATTGLAGTSSATAAAAAPPGDLPVEVTNKSEPVLCAEKDNVTLTFASPQLRRFRIEAVHPVYIGGVRDDRFAPDFTACHDLSAEASSAPPTRRITIYEDVELWLTGYAFSNFWRDSGVPFRIGDRVERGLDVVQLWVRRSERAEEALVVYPADGYWRIRPLPPTHLGWSAYGSSVLIGPVELEGRPVVRLSEIAFDPKTMTFSLAFARGGRATARVDGLDREHLALEVAFDRPVADQPFAALRSMYVTEFNADVARIAVREDGAPGWREEPIMSFTRARAAEVWTGRLVPSRHNMSAPDLIFRQFRTGTDATP